MEKDKIVIDDPRTIYSLSMTVILYEFYKSDIFTNQNNLILSLKYSILLLIIGQVIFLVLRGLLLAEIKDKEKLASMADFAYACTFQMSVIFFIVGLFVLSTDSIFNYFVFPKNLFYNSLYFLIFLISCYMGFVVWKKIFIGNQTKNEIYAFFLLWILFAFIIIFFSK